MFALAMKNVRLHIEQLEQPRDLGGYTAMSICKEEEG